MCTISAKIDLYISNNQTSRATSFLGGLLYDTDHISDYVSNGGMGGELTDLRIHLEELRKTTMIKPE
jgi:hypothetical protein